MSKSIYYDAGKYRLRIEDADLGEAENGTPHVEVYVTVLGHYHERELMACNGPVRTIFLSLTDGTIGTLNEPGWVAQTLTDLGFDWSLGRFDDRRAYAKFKGQERDGECKHQEWPEGSGEFGEKWSIYRNSRSPLKPANSETAKKLNAQFGSLMKQFAKNQSQPTLAPPAKPVASKPAPPVRNAPPAPTRPLQAIPSPDADYTPPDDPSSAGSEIPF